MKISWMAKKSIDTMLKEAHTSRALDYNNIMKKRECYKAVCSFLPVRLH